MRSISLITSFGRPIENQSENDLNRYRVTLTPMSLLPFKEESMKFFHSFSSLSLS